MRMKKYIYCFSFILMFLISSCTNNTPSNEITASGNIEATDVTISSRVAGQIKSILVKEGDQIKEGDVLMKLDHDALDIQLRQAQASVEQAEAQLKLLQAGARKIDIKLAQQQVELAEINLEHAQIEKDRIEKLYESNVATLQQYQQVNTSYDQALSQLNTSKDNLNKIKNPVRPEEIESAKANVKRNIVGIDMIQKNIDDCTIISPVNGIVTKEYVETGEFVTPGASVLNISDLQTVKLVIYVTEEELGKVKLGQKADVTIDSYRDRLFKGEVIYISPEAEFTPKNIQTKEERTKLVYAVKIQIPNTDFTLKSGMPADAKLILN